MASINDIVQVAESLEKSPVLVEGDRCVAVRNRNATCRKCQEACPTDAIEIADNRIELSAHACVACGACSTVCPTAAFTPLKPLDDDLRAAVRASLECREGRVLIACARIASKHGADPACYAEVPCLARVDESLIVGLAADGAVSVELVDGTCATCKYRAVSAGIDETVSSANVALAVQGSEVRASRRSDFPEDARIDDARGLFGTSRRGFFSEAAHAAKDMALTTAKAALDKELGMKKKEPLIGERLRVSKDGSLPRFEVARHVTLIDALDALGTPESDFLITRLFGRVLVDTEKCNGCGMCAVFCPTGAIRRDEAKKPYTNPRFLEFWASECVQCGLCVDVCWKKCIAVSPFVSTAELFDFEPVVFDLTKNAQAQKPRGGLGFGQGR